MPREIDKYITGRNFKFLRKQIAKVNQDLIANALKVSKQAVSNFESGNTKNFNLPFARKYYDYLSSQYGIGKQVTFKQLLDDDIDKSPELFGFEIISQKDNLTESKIKGLLFSNNIKAVRQYLSLSQSQFAEIVNVTRKTISKWENDPPEQIPVKKVSDIYGELSKLKGFSDKIELTTFLRKQISIGRYGDLIIESFDGDTITQDSAYRKRRIIGNNFKAIRTDCRLTIEDVALKIGLSSEEITGFENGLIISDHNKTAQSCYNLLKENHGKSGWRRIPLPYSLEEFLETDLRNSPHFIHNISLGPQDDAWKKVTTICNDIPENLRRVMSSNPYHTALDYYIEYNWKAFNLDKVDVQYLRNLETFPEGITDPSPREWAEHFNGLLFAFRENKKYKAKTIDTEDGPELDRWILNKKWDAE